MAKKKLYKITDEAKVSGVCAGVAEYFNIDVTIVRLVWLLAVFFGIGSPVLIYIIVAIVLPPITRQELIEMDYVKIDKNNERYDDDEDDRW
jgi:phage shock protein PspC (stress-responsive transcriptional regulator)